MVLVTISLLLLGAGGPLMGLLVIMLLPRPQLSLTRHHAVAPAGFTADLLRPRAEPLPPMQELPPSLAATLLSPPPTCQGSCRCRRRGTPAASCKAEKVQRRPPEL